mgnify:CR=1 FL=1
MKHVFIINPKAGKKNNFNAINNKLNEYKNNYDIEIYQTNCAKTKDYLLL